LSVALSPVGIYALVLGLVLFLCVTANVIFIRPMRDCPGCGNRVRLDARWCRQCGYRFVKVRQTR
jgi:predicted amidophosphoribosyltransferase